MKPTSRCLSFIQFGLRKLRDRLKIWNVLPSHGLSLCPVPMAFCFLEIPNHETFEAIADDTSDETLLESKIYRSSDWADVGST